MLVGRGPVNRGVICSDYSLQRFVHGSTFMTARVHVHATFTAPEPTPFFIVAVKVLEGAVEPGMFVTIPFTPSFGMTVRILSTAPVRNDFGIELLGLVLNCDQDSEAREFIDAMNIGDETWTVSTEGSD